VRIALNNNCERKCNIVGIMADQGIDMGELVKNVAYFSEPADIEKLK
jgi:hypothetical protein